MNCSQCQEDLVAYVEGVLDDETAGTVASHLGQCPACGSEADRIARLRDRLTADGESLMKRSLETVVMDRILREETKAFRRILMWKRYGKAGLGLVAAAAVVALVMVNWMTPQEPGRSPISAFKL